MCPGGKITLSLIIVAALLFPTVKWLLRRNKSLNAGRRSQELRNIRRVVPPGREEKAITGGLRYGEIPHTLIHKGADPTQGTIPPP
jgi:hypothetical protein